MIERYGVPTTLQSDVLLKKVKETRKERYGENLEGIVEKTKKTKLERYGDENYNNPIKNQKTCLERYGVEHPLQNSELRRKSKKRYAYKGVQFDSSWELALYIYAKDHNEEIEREPVAFEYEFNGELHLYYPDFKYKGKLIEIKGDQFFKKDGSMCNPYNRLRDGISEAKHQCGLKNGVFFWGKTDVRFAIKYVNKMYGKQYLKEFKNT